VLVAVICRCVEMTISSLVWGDEKRDADIYAGRLKLKKHAMKKYFASYLELRGVAHNIIYLTLMA